MLYDKFKRPGLQIFSRRLDLEPKPLQSHIAMDLADKLTAFRNQSPADVASAANEHLPTVLNILCVGIIAWYLVKILYLMIPGGDVFDSNLPATAPSNNANENPSAIVDFPKIAAAHLFGEAGAEPPPVTTVNAPETRLNLKLRGAIAAEDDETAHAIIADGGGKDKLYFIGDQVPGGAKLHEVYSDRVILNRAGVLETLRLPKTSQGSRPNTANSNRPAPQTTVAGAIPDMIKASPTTFTDIIRPQPYMPNGELAGYRVYPGRDRRKFAALGLRPGDLVTEINGSSLTNLNDSMETFRNMADAVSVNLTVERGNTTMVLTLDTETISSMAGGPPDTSNR